MSDPAEERGAGEAGAGEEIPAAFASEAYEAVFRASPDGVLIVDSRGRMVEANPRMEALFGHSREELLGRSVEMLVPDGLREAHAAHREEYVRDPAPRPMGIGMELRGRRKDGSEVPVEISLSPLERGEETFVIATVRDVTQRRRLRKFGAGALQATEDERRRIARELHDDTAQTLAGLLVRLRVLREASDPRRREELLKEIRGELHSCLEGLRRIARGLRPPALQDAGLVAALRGHLGDVMGKTEVEWDLSADPVDPLLDRHQKLVLYRVCQEALSNALRHSGAGRIEVRIRKDGGRVWAEVDDDGRGFRPDEAQTPEGGLGLLGMEERAAGVGGKLELKSAPGEGTRVRVEVPLDTEERDRG